MTTSWRDVQVDPETRKLIRGSLIAYDDGGIEIRLPHRLESPNKLLHAHWRERTKDKHQWQARLITVISDAAGVSGVAALDRPAAALGLPLVRDRRRLTFERLVPSSRNFIRDRENLVYSVKALCDQVCRMGFIRDDSMKWIDLDVTQRVSEDGRDWTVIRIDIPPGETSVIPTNVPVRAARDRWSR